MSRFDVVWLAGVFEKGGSVLVEKDHVRLRLRSVDYGLLVTVVNVVRRDRLAVPFHKPYWGRGRQDGVKAPWQSPSRPDRWEVAWRGEAARALIVSLLPHLHPKRAARFARALAGVE